MSIKSITPCDTDGICPYDAESMPSCEYWCGEEEPADLPIEWLDTDEIDWGIDFE